ncbi:MAG: AzlC family ABC transporter permease [Ilumatobacteraceae bacterium]|jgi:predicted branched-subunit amino acid permease
MTSAGPASGSRPDPTAARLQARRAGLTVGLATGLYGISFGALATASGLSVLQAQVLSLLMFTGGSQFALVGVLGAGGSGASAITTATLLGVRNTFYALRTAQFLNVSGLRRAAAAHITIDESTAVATAQVDVADQRYGFWLTGLTVFVGWNLMTLAGALAGNALGDPASWGLDAVASAAFLGLLWPRLVAAPARVTAALGAAIAIGLAPHVRPGLPVIAALAGAIVVAWRVAR